MNPVMANAADYLKSRLAMSVAARKVTDLAARCVAAADALKGWRQSCLPAESPSYFEAVAGEGKIGTLDLRGWPDKREIEDALAEYLGCRAAAKAIWDGIPEAHRAFLRPFDEEVP